jgi:hypothetical protein
VVVVKDSAGDLVPGATVTFSGAGLRFSSPTVTTGANGQAAVASAPTAIGSLTAIASVSGASKTATFALDATKATLTVTATSQTIAYNAAIPSPLPYTIAGYVNGDTSKAVTGAPVLTTTATRGSQPGTYPITVSLGTLAATNYTFNLVNGTLTIKSLGVTAAPAATQTITIADATSGAAVYYTINGATPTTSSTKYTGPIAVAATETVKFIAVAPGYTPSAVTTVADAVTSSSTSTAAPKSPLPAVKRGPGPATTTTTVSSSLNPSISGQAVAFKAKVQPSNGSTPTGTVTFRNGGVILGTAALSGGVATLSATTLSVGDHSITATYSGSPTEDGSVSAALAQVVEP